MTSTFQVFRHCVTSLAVLAFAAMLISANASYAADAPSAEATEASRAAADENANASVTKPAELSVAPSTHREFPTDRPAWVDAEPTLETTPHRWPVVSTPCRSEALAEESLKVNLRAAVETYIETITGSVESAPIIALDDQWIQDRRDASKQYRGTIKEGDETLYEAATVLVFDAEDEQMIRNRWQQNLVSHRLGALGVMGAGLITLLVGTAAGLSMVTRRAEQRVAKS
jgi:hypothetical protein